MATRQPNLFPRKNGLKRDPPQNLHPHVPQREAESEEFINEYDQTAETLADKRRNQEHDTEDLNKRKKA